MELAVGDFSADIVVKAEGSVFLFENVKGSEYRVLINGFGSYERNAYDCFSLNFH